jgi:hypothetical protein
MVSGTVREALAEAWTVHVKPTVALAATRERGACERPRLPSCRPDAKPVRASIVDTRHPERKRRVAMVVR